jgi:hypothetical protein
MAAMRVGTCETCGALTDLWIYALPGIPISVGNCRVCMETNSYPWTILVANTVAIGGMDHAADWWKDAVNVSLARLGKTRQEFYEAVTAALKEEYDPQDHAPNPSV